MSGPTISAADISWKPNGRDPSAPPVALADVLHDLEVFIRRYVVVTEDQALTVALWIAHTHAIGAADCTPYLHITAATKQAGKTRLLEVCEPLVARPWLTGRTSPAALVRKVDAQTPTLLLDESDAALGANADREYAEHLRGLLNTGYRSSGRTTLCVGQGAKIETREFSTFGPKAIAGIGELPGTVGDRSIRIELKRRTSREPCARWRERDGHAAASPLHAHLVAWALRSRVLETLRDSRPAVLEQLTDRQQDCWEPLLAIADLAGGEWPARSRRAAIALTGAAAAQDGDVVVELLRDIYEVLRDWTAPMVPTKDLIAKLVDHEDRPWATWRHDKPITARGLARLLGPLGISPARLERVRGYRADAFGDAFSRYLPSQASLRHFVNNDGPESPIPIRQPEISADASKIANTPESIEQMTLAHIDAGKSAITSTSAAIPTEKGPHVRERF